MAKLSKYKFVILLIIINTKLNNKIIKDFINIIFFNKEIVKGNQINFEKKCKYTKIYSIKQLANVYTKINNFILLLEVYNGHNECTPGFSKYFVDLKYKVDIVIHREGVSSFCFFEPIKDIRLFIYENKKDFNNIVGNFSLIIKKYEYILLESTVPKGFNLYKKLGLLNINKSLFVFHHIDFANSKYFKKNLKKYQILSLGKFSSGIQVNPHYFGDLRIRKKNIITTFFITSTIKRKYNFILSAFEKIKDEQLSFHVNVVGRYKTFSEIHISKKLKKDFTFKYKIPYSELYKEVILSDFIIINLNPNNKDDIKFSKIRVTGSAQLAYGFSKPVLINNKFANYYKFNYTNSIIYDNTNFTEAIRVAINMNNNQYKEIQENLSLLSKEIYAESLSNLKKCLIKL